MLARSQRPVDDVTGERGAACQLDDDVHLGRGEERFDVVYEHAVGNLGRLLADVLGTAQHAAQLQINAQVVAVMPAMLDQ